MTPPNVTLKVAGHITGGAQWINSDGDVHIVAEDGTIQVPAGSKALRDALAQGFSIAVPVVDLAAPVVAPSSL